VYCYRTTRACLQSYLAGWLLPDAFQLLMLTYHFHYDVTPQDRPGMVRCSFFRKDFHSRMLLDHMITGLKPAYVCSNRMPLGCPLSYRCHHTSCCNTEGLHQHHRQDIGTGCAQLRLQWARVRCAFPDRNLHSRMPLDPTHVRLKRTRV
jgi:hypothetical protein